MQSQAKSSVGKHIYLPVCLRGLSGRYLKRKNLLNIWFAFSFGRFKLQSTQLVHIACYKNLGIPFICLLILCLSLFYPFSFNYCEANRQPKRHTNRQQASQRTQISVIYFYTNKQGDFTKQLDIPLMKVTNQLHVMCRHM